MKRNDCRKPRGSVYVNNGYWYVDVRLPGEDRRRKHPLRAPGANAAMRADRPREMAVEAAHRLWEEAVRQRRDEPSGRTVDDVCDRYVRHAYAYYAGGKEANTAAAALRTFREMFGARPISELVHSDVVAVRDAMARSGRYCRTTVNRYVHVITGRMLPWACDMGLVRPAVRVELSGVVPLRRGRSEAREPRPVRAAPDAAVDATVAAMVPSVADMVRVHRLTGMRPCELCCLKWSDVDETVTPWRYEPARNKNAWRNQPRVVCIGPRARAILGKYRGRERPFSPAAAVAEWMEAKRAAATSPSRYDRASPHARRVPGDEWNTQAYGQSIAHACARAGVARWTPNQLRHSFATEVRRKFGLQAAAVLGHWGGGRVTDLYSWEAAADEMYAAAAPAVEALG